MICDLCGSEYYGGDNCPACADRIVGHDCPKQEKIPGKEQGLTDCDVCSRTPSWGSTCDTCPHRPIDESHSVTPAPQNPGMCHACPVKCDIPARFKKYAARLVSIDP